MTKTPSWPKKTKEVIRYRDPFGNIRKRTIYVDDDGNKYVSSNPAFVTLDHFVKHWDIVNDEA